MTRLMCVLVLFILTSCSSQGTNYAHNWDSMTYDVDTVQVPGSFLASLTEKIK
jgi:hypothetical protein